MAEGHHRLALHVGVIFPTPVPPRPIREWYQVVPDGIDITTVSLTTQQLTDDNMEEALKGMERAAKQLSDFDVDVIYQSGVPPIVARKPLEDDFDTTVVTWMNAMIWASMKRGKVTGFGKLLATL
jgi:maleate cis-trans isomerase